jgi:putative SOS response-associated peptidase YedK
MCYSVMVARDVSRWNKRLGTVMVRDTEHLEYQTLNNKFPRQFPKLVPRIYANYFAPVVFLNSAGELQCEYMRYSAFPPRFATQEGKRFSTFNARRDNLKSPFWQDCLGKGHGIVVLSHFFEWVRVVDLLAAGTVDLEAVVDFFKKQLEQKEMRAKEFGKKFALTANDKKPPKERKIVIQFSTSDQDSPEILCPVIFNAGEIDDTGIIKNGFAIVTDDPPQEVLSAGHDRCPIALTSEAASEWLIYPTKKDQKYESILEKKDSVRFRHTLEERVS